MNTTKDASVKSIRGRKPLPAGDRKVMFSKRIHPSKIPEVEALLNAGRVAQKDLQNKLLEDVDSLTKQVQEYQDRYEATLKMGDDGKLIYWRNRAIVAEQNLTKLQGDGSY